MSPFARLMQRRRNNQREQLTISEEWEVYARKNKDREFWLGDEWNEPERIGVDVAPDQIVQTLDERVFTPFLGTCDVLLEIGPGGGRFTEVLLPKCRRLIAADTSKTMLDILGRRFEGEDRIERLLLDGDGLNGVLDASIDAVFTYGVFVHLQPWDIYRYLCEIRRVLRPGGKGLVHHPNTLSELGWATFVGDVPRSVNRHKPGGTFTVMTPELMSAFIERSGLRLEKIDNDTVRRDSITMFTCP